MDNSKTNSTPFQFDPEMLMLSNNKTEGWNYRERRHEAWHETYALSRDKVTVNRLTMRQSVNLPLMKNQMKTVMKDIDDMPVIYFENLDNDKQKELFQNEHWKETLNLNNAEIQDFVDKKQEFLYGRTFDQWQIADGMIKMIVQEPEDIKVSRFIDPTNLHSSRYLIHENIFVPLAVLEQNEDYDQVKVRELKEWFATEMGIIKKVENNDSYEAKQKKLVDMGLIDAYNPVLGETVVQMTLHFVWHKEEDDEEQIWLYVEVEDQKILMKKRLEEVIGVTEDHFWKTHYPYVSWASDVDRQDFWSDGIGDCVRIPNKVINAWFSQLVENRTLKNLNMNLYDSAMEAEGFVPQTWEPKAWGMYSIPVPDGKTLEQVFTQLKVADLGDNLDEIQFVIAMVEKTTGATATQQGSANQKQVTLGEIKLMLTEAKEKTQGISKFYTKAWHDRALIYLKLIEAASEKLDLVKIHRKGLNTDNIYTREILPKDYITKSGYHVKIWDQSEKDTQDTQKLEKTNAVKQNMPDNPVVDDLWKRGMLEFIGATPEKVNEAMQFEAKKREALIAGMNNMGGGTGPAIPGQQGVGPALNQNANMNPQVTPQLQA